jgi:hypothetical protein
VGKYGTTRQATDDNIIRRMRFACWIAKATYTHSECVILITFSTATMVTGTRLSVTFKRTVPVLFYLIVDIQQTFFKFVYVPLSQSPISLVIVV